MGTLWNIIVGLGGGLLKVIVKVLEMMRDKQLIDQGKALERAEQDKRDAAAAKIEVAVVHEQEKILLGDSTRDELANNMINGKF